jgi:hypothetical protein
MYAWQENYTAADGANPSNTQPGDDSIRTDNPGHKSLCENPRKQQALQASLRDSRRLLRGRVAAGRGRGLGAVWPLVDEGNVHGQFGIAPLCFRLLPGYCTFCFFGDHGAL